MAPRSAAKPPESRYDALQALRAVLDAAIAAAEPRELAALSREKRQVMAELDSLAGTSKGSPIDELDKRRAARRAAAAVRASTGGGSGQRRKRGG